MNQDELEEFVDEFVENCRFTKRELIVLITVQNVNEELDQEDAAIMKQIVENSDIDHKTLHDGWRKLVPKGLLAREEVKTSSKIWVTEKGQEAIENLKQLNEIVKEAKEQADTE